MSEEAKKLLVSIIIITVWIYYD